MTNSQSSYRFITTNHLKFEISKECPNNQSFDDDKREFHSKHFIWIIIFPELITKVRTFLAIAFTSRVISFYSSAIIFLSIEA